MKTVKLSDFWSWSIWVAWVVQGIFLAFVLFSEPLRFGFAPAVCIVLWLAIAVYAIEKSIYSALSLHPIWLLAVLLSLVLSTLYPGHEIDSSVSIWLPLHSAFGLASYALFTLAVFHAWQLSRKEGRIRSHRIAANDNEANSSIVWGVSAVPLLTLERLMFHFVLTGFLLLSITLVLGLGFREYLYGVHAIWRWEHKTLFAMLAWFVFASLLILRYTLGWRGRSAVRMVYAGAGVLLLSYVGSRFVLEVLLGR
jgi:ABC-type uncharacterized transport system permease subunit